VKGTSPSERLFVATWVAGGGNAAVVVRVATLAGRDDSIGAGAQTNAARVGQVVEGEGTDVNLVGKTVAVRVTRLDSAGGDETKNRSRHEAGDSAHPAASGCFD